MGVGDFAAEVARTVADGRELAEARMDSACRIFYSTGRTTLDPTTRIEAPVYADRATDVPCRVSAQQQVNADTTGPLEMLGSRVTREISIPVSSAQVYAGDFLELTTIGALTDAALAGVRFRVVDAGAYSQGTARRLKVEVDV